jgi:hypothetical protein
VRARLVEGALGGTLVVEDHGEKREHAPRVPVDNKKEKETRSPPIEGVRRARWAGLERKERGEKGGRRGGKRGKGQGRVGLVRG